MSGELSQRLWTDNADGARRTLEHPFVQGLGRGTLAAETFRNYIAQDAFFLEAFARAYALAIAHSPDRECLYTFCDLLQGVLEELKLHARYAEKWQVDLADAAPMDATTAYTSFLLETARRGDVGLICAAMTPCMRLYAWLGRQLTARYGIPDHDYGEWIKTYADPEFEKLATHLEHLLDVYARDTPATRDAYRRAMELEYDFFDAHGP